jgi:hypothetical protein
MVSLEPTLEPDVEALAPTPTVRLAAGLVVLEGFLAALGAFQLFLSVSFVSPWVALVPWLLLFAGLPTFYVGTQLYRMRGWAALASIVAMAILGFGTIGWTVFAATHGLVSCLTMIMPIVGITGLVLGIVALPACRRADSTRERLRDAGMDLGI